MNADALVALIWHLLVWAVVARWLPLPCLRLPSRPWRCFPLKDAWGLAPGTGIRGILPRLRCVFDLRNWNNNSEKVASPLQPDMEGILRRVSKNP
jgi:hypothetical protein